jgi:polysaccharide pyruvyl transferase CsaB
VTLLRVAAAGCYSINHPGEEAEIAAAAASLRALSPRIEITIFSQNTRQVSQLPGVRAVNRWNPFAVLYTLIKSDLVFSCGRDSLKDTEGMGSLISHLLTIFTARLIGKPVVCYAQGVGPLNSYWGRRLVRFVGDRFDLITVRNQASKDRLLKIGVERPPIVVTADPVFSLSPAQFDKEVGHSLMAQIRSEASDEGDKPPFEPIARAEEGKITISVPVDIAGTGEGETEAKGEAEGEPKGEKKPLLGIVLQELEGDCEYKRAIASAADKLVREGWEILLLPFKHPADIQICQEVSWIMQESSLQYREKPTLEQLFCLFGEVDLLLGMRLPALIMASLMRRPCIGIALNEKIDKFLEMTEQPKAVNLEDLDADNLYELITSTYKDKKEIATHIDQVLIQLRQQSWESAGLSLSFFYSRFPHKRLDTPRTAGWGERHKAGRTIHR